MKRRRLWINLALIVGIIVVIVAILSVVLRPQSIEAPQRTATVAEATVTATVTASGTVESLGDIALAFGSSGIVTSVDVSAGDDVRAGQVLATIDRTAAQQQVAAAEATLAQALSAQVSSESSVALARQDLALATEAAKASNATLKAAVVQARSNLAEAEKLWADACVNPDDPTCASAATAEAVRAARERVNSAQLDLDAAVATAASRRTTYDLNVNQAAVALQDQRTLAQRQCDEYGSDSTTCLSANQSVTSSLHVYEDAVDTRRAGLLTNQQAVDSARGALATANVALRKAIADAAKAGSDSVRQARQALTNAELARERGRATNEQAVLAAERALASAQANVTDVDTADGSSTSQAAAAIASARAALATAQDALERTAITAPVDGTVASVNLTVGASSTPASVSSSSNASSAAITIIPAGVFTAVADFAEYDAAQVIVGDPALVTFQALPGVSIPGKVLRIDPSASTSATDQLVTFRIEVSMDGIPSTVRPGMTASIAITTDEIAGVLAIPQAAITTVGGVSTVQLLQPDNTTVETQVELGIKGDSLTEITAGVESGDVLVIPTGTSGVSEFPRGGPPGAPQSRSRG